MSPVERGGAPAPGDDLRSRLRNDLSPQARQVLDAVRATARRLRITAWLVGGPVRDLLLQRPVVDLDVMVEGPGPEFASALGSLLGARIKVFERFGTARLLLPRGEYLDITTARSERYPRPGALPVVGPGTLADDLLRRDFSINALALSLGPQTWGILADPHGGLDDLARGIIRILHRDSFHDDPTRVLRAVRFEARYGFRIEPHTLEQLIACVRPGGLESVSRERVREEVVAILGEPDPRNAVTRMGACGILEALLGSHYRVGADLSDRLGGCRQALAWYEGRRQKHSDLPAVEPWIVYWLVITGRESTARTRQVTGRWRMGRRVLRCLDELEGRRSAGRHLLGRPYQGADSALYRLLHGLPGEGLLALLAETDQRYARPRLLHFLLHLRAVRPLVDGHDLQALGVPPGPYLGHLLERLLEAQIDGHFRDRHAALAEARRLAAACPAGETGEGG